MVISCSPRPMRAVQRARLWASTWTASQAPFGRFSIGGETAGGEIVEPHAGTSAVGRLPGATVGGWTEELAGDFTARLDAASERMAL